MIADGWIQTLRRLLSSWWRVDRIRIATSTGHLLQLAPGDRVLVDGCLLMIQQRIGLVRNENTKTEVNSDSTQAFGIEYRLEPIEMCQPGADDGDLGIDDRCGATESWLQILLSREGESATHRYCNGSEIMELLDEHITAFPAGTRWAELDVAHHNRGL